MKKKVKIHPVNYFEKKKRRKSIIIGIAVVIIIITAIVFLYKTKIIKKTYKGYKVIQSIESLDEGNSTYVSKGEDFIKYSQNGITNYNRRGETLWNVSYQMYDPIIEKCEGYIVVADRGGRELEIINKDGKSNKISTVHNILKVVVANQGVSAVLMEEQGKSYITIYDEQGEVLVEKIFNTNKNGMPLDLSISNDGSKLITSYTSVKAGVLGNTITFYNYGEVGKNHAGRLVGGIELKETIVPRVKFINNDIVCAFKENGFILYEIKERPEEITTIEVDSKIKSVIYNETHIGCVVEKGGALQQLIIYDLTGKKVLEKDINFKFDHIALYEKEIIMVDSLSVLILELDGSIKFEEAFESNLSLFIPGGDGDKYIIINDNELKRIKLLEKE